MPTDAQPIAGQTVLHTARDALRRGDWASARAGFEAQLMRGDDSAEVWEGLGIACHWLQDAARMFEARQHAYQAYRAGGDLRSAARLAILLASDCLEFRGESAIAAGWLERAHQLLDAWSAQPNTRFCA